MPPKKYRIDSLNQIIVMGYATSCDQAAIEVGNCFDSKEEAYFELERKKIEAVFREYAVKKPLLTKDRKYYHICCIHDDLPFSPSVLSVSGTKVIDFGTPLFDTKEDAYKAIEAAGGAEHVMKYYFSGV